MGQSKQPRINLQLYQATVANTKTANDAQNCMHGCLSAERIGFTDWIGCEFLKCVASCYYDPKKPLAPGLHHPTWVQTGRNLSMRLRLKLGHLALQLVGLWEVAELA